MLKYLSGRINTAYQLPKRTDFDSALKRTLVWLRHVRIIMHSGMILRTRESLVRLFLFCLEGALSS